MTQKIGLLTTGGDSPGTNAAIRAIGKAAQSRSIHVTGFLDGFSGMAENQFLVLDGDAFSGILTRGGTMLGTNRDLPFKVLMDGQTIDRTADIVQVYRQHQLDCLVCLGGGGAQESAQALVRAGLNVVTIPVTIDNDIPFTDASIGFNTAVETAAEAIDRLHSTAISHHRIIIVEIMGRETGWLTLAAGIAGGADVILIPEIPYDFQIIAGAVARRNQRGKRFSLVAVSEGAISLDNARFFESARKASERLHTGRSEEEIVERLERIEKQSAGDTLHLARQLEKLTGLVTRVSILGYVQRGGTPSAFDRLLATQLGTACVEFISAGKTGIMVAIQNGDAVAVPLGEVAGKVMAVPREHAWIAAARRVGTCLGD
jgi:6-phosphofructokinase 1